MAMRVVMAGGGTGGHLYPGIAVAREFQRRFKEAAILFIGTEQGIESRVLPTEGFPLRTISTGGWVGKGWPARWRVFHRLPGALIRSWGILKDFRPDVVIGVGGYASGPVIAAAALMRIPTVILEQNVLPGVTNRLLSAIVNRVIIAFEGSRSFLRGRDIRCLGNPVRAEIFRARERMNVPGDRSGNRKTILIFGGSRGAHALNRAMTDALSNLVAWRDRVVFIHQTGDRDHAWVREAYEAAGFIAEVTPYLDRMAEAYSRADLVVARAGATTVAELTAAARPAILIPYPHAAGGHQERNAEMLRTAGAAEMILEDRLTGTALSERIADLLKAPEALRRMGEAAGRLAKPDAAEKIVEMCVEMIGGG
jgi:UDP-N-acetylglucosamine--N-acetylmuramyl-(pentapeptide) pyrophosphoryl-undecaprenol N-acetylglucosamine transferase